MIATTYIFSDNSLIEWLILMAIAVPLWLYWNATARPSKGTGINPDGTYDYDDSGPVRGYGGGRSGGSSGGNGHNNFSDFMDDGGD